MNTFLLQRLTFLAVLPLCTLIVVAAARADGHHPHGNDLVNIGHDSNLPRGQTANSVVSIFGSSTSDGEAGDGVGILGDTRGTGEGSDRAGAVLGKIVIDGKIAGAARAVLRNMEGRRPARVDRDVVTA